VNAEKRGRFKNRGAGMRGHSPLAGSLLGDKLELDAVSSLMLGIAVPADPRAQLVFANVLLANFLNSLDVLVKRDRNPSG